jgi:hypothetical protein
MSSDPGRIYLNPPIAEVADTEFDVFLAQIEEIYDLCDGPAVWQFLRAHPELLSLLLDAPLYIERYFPTNSALTLEVVQDAEDDNWQELFINIGVALDPDAAADQLHLLDVSCLTRHQANGILHFDVDLL